MSSHFRDKRNKLNKKFSLTDFSREHDEWKSQQPLITQVPCLYDCPVHICLIIQLSSFPFLIGLRSFGFQNSSELQLVKCQWLALWEECSLFKVQADNERWVADAEQCYVTRGSYQITIESRLGETLALSRSPSIKRQQQLEHKNWTTLKQVFKVTPFTESVSCFFVERKALPWI